MKKIIFTLTLIIPIFIFSQEKGTYQNDSIYKVNKVKIRKWYGGKKLTATTYYDREGRMVKFQHEPFVGGEQRTIYYEYDNKGLLINKIDTTKNGKPDKKTLRKLKKMGLDLTKKIKNNKPKIEVSKFKIEYQKKIISKITEFNPDGTLKYIDHFKNKGKIQIREWYQNGKIYRESTTEFLDDFHKEKYYGWRTLNNGKKREWNYSFEYVFENGQVKEFTRFDNGKKEETVKYVYNKKGLLIRMEDLATEIFKYEYYN